MMSESMPNEFLLGNLLFDDEDSQAVQIAADHLRLGRPDAARLILQDILKRIPHHSGALNCLAAEAMMRGDVKKTEEILQLALTINPQDTVALGNLGNLHLHHQRIAEARLCLERAEALAGLTPALESLLIHILSAEGEFDVAISLQEKVLEKNPKNAENHYNLGVLLARSQQHTSAEECFQRAIFQRPAYREAWHNLGQLQARSGRLKEAIFSFKRALLLLPGDPATISTLVDVLIQSDRASDAEEEAKRGLIVTPGAVLSILALGRAQLALGRKQDALTNFASAVRAAPEHPLPLMSLARGFAALGNYAKAADAAIMATRRPGGTAFRDFAGDLLLKFGRFSAAWQVLAEATPDIPSLEVAENFIQIPEDILQVLCLAPLLRLAQEQSGKDVFIIPHNNTVVAGRLLSFSNIIEKVAPPTSNILALAQLGMVLRPDPTSIPLPTLVLDDTKASAWRRALGARDKPVIALAFNGENDGEPPLAEILKILNFPCTKLAIFTGDARRHLDLDPDMLDAGPHLIELSDIAAAMASADFVIAGRGIGGHLAGAFGLSGAVLVPRGSDWCWGVEHGPSWFRSLHSCQAGETGWGPALAELSNLLVNFQKSHSLRIINGVEEGN